MGHVNVIFTRNPSTASSVWLWYNSLENARSTSGMIARDALTAVHEYGHFFISHGASLRPDYRKQPGATAPRRRGRRRGSCGHCAWCAETDHDALRNEGHRERDRRIR